MSPAGTWMLEPGHASGLVGRGGRRLQRRDGRGVSGLFVVAVLATDADEGWMVLLGTLSLLPDRLILGISCLSFFWGIIEGNPAVK